MVIYWNDEFMVEKQHAHDKGGTPGQGKVMAPLAPFKGICNHCGTRTTVRHYPWSIAKWFGTFCKNCITKIEEELSEETPNG